MVAADAVGLGSGDGDGLAAISTVNVQVVRSGSPSAAEIVND